MILEKDINLIKGDVKLIKELASLYFATFGKRMKVGCGACYQKSYIELKQKLNFKKMKTENTCRFKLRVSSIRAFGSNSSYTNETLTEEIAIKYLKQNINRISQFSEYPSDYLELVNGKKSEKITILEEPKEEVKEIVSEEVKEKKPRKKRTAKTSK